MATLGLERTTTDSAGSAHDALLLRTHTLIRAVAVVSARIAELVFSAPRLDTAMIDSAVQIVATGFRINAITRLTITALPLLTPNIACAGAVFFKLTTPQQAVATTRRKPGTISIGHAARAVVRLAGQGLGVAASISPSTIEVLLAGHR
jgi:hypothetical protein